MGTTPGTVPGFQIPNPPVRKSKTLVWVLGVGGVLALVMLWQCGTALWRGRNLSNDAVAHFHDQLNQGKYEDLIAESDDAFRASAAQEKLVSYLSSVHSKLGNAGKSSMTSININATVNGTFLKTVYSTMFTSGEATESFIWVKRNGVLRLYHYNVNSAALLN
jgi:hypothetical protein